MGNRRKNQEGRMFFESLLKQGLAQAEAQQSKQTAPTPNPNNSPLKIEVSQSVSASDKDSPSSALNKLSHIIIGLLLYGRAGKWPID